MSNYTKKIILTILLIFQVIILIGCGDGSSSTSSGMSTSTGPTNTTSSDEEVPTLAKTSPANGATNISTNAQIQLNFSESVTNVNTKTVTLHESSPTGKLVDINDLIANPNKDVYTFNAKTTLKSSTLYYVVLSNEIKSLVTDKPLESTSFYFVTGDFVAPTVSAIYPTDGESNVPISLTIQLQFSTDVTNVNTSTVTLHESDPSGTIIETSSIIGGPDTNNVYSFSPSQHLKSNTKYYVELDKEIVSVSNNEALIPIGFSFTTGQVSNPTVALLNPQNNSNVGSLKPIISIKFSESVSGIGDGVFLYESSPSGHLVGLSPITAHPNNIYSFKPKFPLSTYTNYYLRIGSRVVSLNSGESVVPTVFSFYVTGPKLAYVVSGGHVNVCNVTESGQFDNCQLIYGESTAYRVSIDDLHKFAYLMNRNANNISVCQLDRAYGVLNNCTKTGNNLNKPTGIAFDQTGSYAYVTNNGDNHVLICQVNKLTGELNMCAYTGDTAFNIPDAITINHQNNYAYIVNTGANNIIQCQVTQPIGLLQHCYPTGNALVAPKGVSMDLKNNILYTTSHTKLTVCIIDNNTGLLSCQDASATEFLNLIDLAVDKEKIYVADATIYGNLSLCYRKSDDTVGQCSYIKLDSMNLTGITVLAD